MTIVGLSGVLQAKIAHYLVPTLAESFALTAAVIFVAFLVVFRSGRGAADGDDPVAVRDPGDVPRDAGDAGSR